MQPEEQTESHDKRIFRHSPYGFSCPALYIEPTGHYSPTLYYMYKFFFYFLAVVVASFSRFCPLAKNCRNSSIFIQAATLGLSPIIHASAATRSM